MAYCEPIMADELIQTSLRIPKDLWKTLKFIALQQDKSLQDVIIEGLQEYADSKAPKKSK